MKKKKLTALGNIFIIGHQTSMFGRVFNLVPIDALSIAQVFVLQNNNRPGVDPLEGAESKRDEGSLDNIKRGEVLGELSSTDNLQVPEVPQIGKVFVITLYI